MRPCSIDGRGEARKADGVAGGVDVRRPRSGTSSGPPSAARDRSGVEAAGGEVERRGRADPAGGRTAACPNAAAGRPPAPRRACSCSNSMRATFAPKRTSMPRSRRWCRKSSTSSWSMKSSRLVRGSTRVTLHVERAEDGGVFDADHAGADHRQAARQAGDSTISSLSKTVRAVERHVRRAERPRCRPRSGSCRPRSSADLAGARS